MFSDTLRITLVIRSLRLTDFLIHRLNIIKTWSSLIIKKIFSNVRFCLQTHWMVHLFDFSVLGPIKVLIICVSLIEEQTTSLDKQISPDSTHQSLTSDHYLQSFQKVELHSWPYLKVKTSIFSKNPYLKSSTCL